MTVAAVVVTFNRKELLIDTLKGLKAQSHKPDHIYLVDNASTDGTRTYLMENGVLDWPDLEYIELEQNTGGAGGFFHGMELALNSGYDWIWTMDDDVEPDAGALETLLKYTGISECINSSKIFTENNEVQYWEQYFDFATCRLIDLKNSSFETGKDWCNVNVACFEGMLVSRGVVEKIGLPDPSYFICHDDTIFGIRASLHTNVIYVRDAIFYKKIYGYGAVTPLRCYYMLRNSFRLKREAFATGLLGQPSKFTNLLFFLNLMNLSLQYFWERKQLAILKALSRGWIDGLRGK